MYLSEGVDDLLVGQFNTGGISRLVVHVEPEHLPVDKVHLPTTVRPKNVLKWRSCLFLTTRTQARMLPLAYI